jgi:3-oxoadipate enol-lactonase
MSFLECAGGVKIHYALSECADAPVVVLSNSLGTNFSMWDPQAPALEREFRLLRYDQRGHGQTSTTPGPYTIEMLARDLLRLLDSLKLDKVNFCGLSMGGLTGMWLGVHAPERFQKLIISNTGAKIGTPEVWNPRIETVRKSGMKSIAAAVVERWYTREFRAASPKDAAATLRMLENTPPEGYAGCCEAIRDCDLLDAISSIRIPTLVISGAKDPATPPASGRFIADKIPGARYVELPAAHLSNIEAPEQFTNEVIRFFKS